MVLEATVIEQVYNYVKDHRFLGVEFLFLCTAAFLFSLFSVAFDLSVDRIKISVSDAPALTILVVVSAAVLVEAFDPNMRGSGIPEMKIALSKNMNRRTEAMLNLRAFLVKSVGLFLVLTSGLPFGREGPFVHMASMAFYLLFHFLVCVLALGCVGARQSRAACYGRRPEFSPSMLSSACALGVACTFASPIGGVLFSIEVTNKQFKVRNYWKCCLIAVIGSIVFRLFGREMDLSKVTNEAPVTLVSMTRSYGTAILIGIFGAVTALCFLFLFKLVHHALKAIPLAMNWVQGAVCRGMSTVSPVGADRPVRCPRLRRLLHPAASLRGLAHALVRTLLLAGTNILIYKCLMFETTDNLAIFLNKTDFTNQSLFLVHTGLRLPNQLLLLLLTKMVVAILLIHLPVPCGVFKPLMLLGAVFGRYFAALVTDPFIPSSLMGVLGAASVAGAVTQTVSAAIIVVDLSNQEQYLILALLSAFVSNVIYKLFRPWNVLSIYDTMANFRQMAYLPDEMDEKYHAFTVVRVDSLREPAVDISVRERAADGPGDEGDEDRAAPVPVPVEGAAKRSRPGSVSDGEAGPGQALLSDAVLQMPLRHLVSRRVIASGHHFYRLVLARPGGPLCVGLVYTDEVKRFLRDTVPDLHACVEHLHMTDWLEDGRFAGCRQCSFAPAALELDTAPMATPTVLLVPREVALVRQRFRRRWLASRAGRGEARSLVYTPLCHVTSWVPPYWNLLDVHDLMHERKYFQVLVSGDTSAGDVITYERVLQKIDDLHKNGMAATRRKEPEVDEAPVAVIK